MTIQTDIYDLSNTELADCAEIGHDPSHISKLTACVKANSPVWLEPQICLNESWDILHFIECQILTFF